ncbi:MAG: hypothetical protein ACK6CE_00070 [Planctomycetota bacterium]
MPASNDADSNRLLPIPGDQISDDQVARAQVAGARANWLGWQPGVFAFSLSAAAIGLWVLDFRLWSEWLLLVQGGLLGWLLAFGPGPAWQRLVVVWVLAVFPVWLVAQLLGLEFGLVGTEWALFRGQVIFVTTLVSAAGLLLADLFVPLAPTWGARKAVGAGLPPSVEESGRQKKENAGADLAEGINVAEPAGEDILLPTKAVSSRPSGSRRHLQWSIADWGTLLVVISLSLGLAQVLVQKTVVVESVFELAEQVSAGKVWLAFLRQGIAVACVALLNVLLILAPLTYYRERRLRTTASTIGWLAEVVGIWGSLSALLLLFIPLYRGLELVGIVVTSAVIPALFLVASLPARR